MNSLSQDLKTIFEFLHECYIGKEDQTGIFNFEIKRKDEEDLLTSIIIKGNSIQIDFELHEKGSCVVKCDEKTLLQMFTGELEPSVAVMFGQIQVEGDLNSLLSFSQSFDISKENYLKFKQKTKPLTTSKPFPKKEEEKVVKEKEEEEEEEQKEEEQKEKENKNENENEKEIQKKKENSSAEEKEEIKEQSKEENKKQPSTHLAIAFRFAVWSCEQPEFESKVLFNVLDVDLQSVVMKLSPQTVIIEELNQENNKEKENKKEMEKEKEKEKEKVDEEKETENEKEKEKQKEKQKEIEIEKEKFEQEISEEEYMVIFNCFEKPLIQYLTGEYTLLEMFDRTSEEEFSLWELESGFAQVLDQTLSLSKEKYREFVQEQKEQIENEDIESTKIKKLSLNAIALLTAGAFNIMDSMKKLSNTKKVKTVKKETEQLFEKAKNTEAYSKFSGNTQKMVFKIKNSQSYSKLTNESKQIYQKFIASDRWSSTKNETKQMYQKLKEKDYKEKTIKGTKQVYQVAKHGTQEMIGKIKQSNTYEKVKKETEDLLEKIMANETVSNLVNKTNKRVKDIKNSPKSQKVSEKINEKIKEGKEIINEKRGVESNNEDPFNYETLSNLINEKKEF
ncbi:chascon [Anaeramoeba flamelloides]|uniref:Chascon n=1 Tax=Anaeramoeba flamelloides TaxID=1746091 RepID=A0ABQ8YEN8_9EUKA|nr:chascon [Anaeramoeba flamelloides]